MMNDSLWNVRSYSLKLSKSNIACEKQNKTKTVLAQNVMNSSTGSFDKHN